MADFDFVWPPFRLGFIGMGILLIPVVASTLFRASGMQASEAWSWRIGFSNALTILRPPFVLALTMERRCLAAIPFLAAAILITWVGVFMVWPYLWVRAELRPSQPAIPATKA